MQIKGPTTQSNANSKQQLAPPCIKAILWDMDGTLLDTETVSDVAIYEALDIHPEIRKTNQYRLPWEIKEPTLGKRGDEWVPMVIEYAVQHWNLNNPPHWDEMWNKQEQILNSYCEQVKECKGATALVEKLASLQVPMCIATSSRMASVEKKRINHDGIFRHMRTIVTGEMIDRPKPQPDIYIEAAKRLQVEPSECLVFEDSVAGCQAGKAAGCWVIGVPDARMTDLSPFDGIADQILPSLEHFDFEAWSFFSTASATEGTLN
jgi:HAD superfamily hydrolase (TIGR01509 family)